MLRRIIKREILENFMSVRFILLLLLCILLIPLGIYVNEKDYESRLAEYHQLSQKYREDLAKTTDIREIKPKGFEPPSPLGVFAKGLEETLPKYFTTSKFQGIQWGENSVSGDLMTSLFGKVDFLFIVKVILSLVAILFTFDAISGEKEKGTLKLTLSNPLPRDSLLLAKLAGGFITFLVPLIVAWLMGILVLSLLPFPLFEHHNFLRIVLMLATSIIYILIFFNLGLLVSSSVKSSMNSILILLSIWVILVQVIPGVSNLIAKRIKAVKSEQMLNIEKSLIVRDIELEKSRRLEEIRPTFTPQNLEQGRKEYQRYQQARAPIVKELQERQASQIVKLEGDYQRRRRVQESIAFNIARVSPASSLTYILTELADTGAGKRERFFTAARVYQEIATREVFSKFWTDIFPDGYRLMGWEQFDKDSLPAFAFKKQDLGQALESSWVDFLLLLVFNIILFMGAYASFLRSDIT